MPFGLCVDRQEIPSAVAVALIVDPAWRLRGVGPALSDTMRESHRVVCALSISDDAARMYRRTGWIDLGELPRFVLPLSTSALRGSGRRNPGTGVAVTLAATYARMAARLGSMSTKFVPTATFDERADAIWETANSSYAVLACRAAAELTWRFDQGPHQSLYRRFYLLRHGLPVGYAVIRSKASDGRLTLKIVDYFAPPTCTGALLSHGALSLGARNTRWSSSLR